MGYCKRKTVTLSFQVYSSLTGTFGGVLRNSADNRSYPFTYSIASANTWTSISVTVAGDTSGTWLTNNGVGIRVSFGLGVGSTYSGTAGAWAGTSYQGATGATSVVGTSGATLYITGVQLEANTTATPFEHLQYGTQLALCQRYFQKSWDQGDAVGSAVSASANTVQQSWGSSNAASIAGQSIALPVNMRTAPTLVVYDMALTSGKVTTQSAGAVETNNVSANTSAMNESRFIVRMYANSAYGLVFAYTLTAEL